MGCNCGSGTTQVRPATPQATEKPAELLRFIVPSTCRQSIYRAVASLLAQTDPDWTATVVHDDCEMLAQVDPRLTYLRSPKLGTLGQNGHGGLVRNYGIDNSTSQWLAFLDDDDEVIPAYVAIAKTYISDAWDVLIFRMRSKGQILPAYGAETIAHCNVGISFLVRRAVMQPFVNADSEDFLLLKSLQSAGARIKFADEVTYIVGG